MFAKKHVNDYITVEVICMLFRRVHCSSATGSFAILLFFASIIISQLSAGQPPRLAQKDGRYALFVDGHPYLILGGQIHNSSAWPSELPQVWESMAALHANTLEAPVYWEQFESEPGKFDFTNVDAIVEGARVHHLHVIILWFGTWKNGNMHYVPAWVKNDPSRFPPASGCWRPLFRVSAWNEVEKDVGRRGGAYALSRTPGAGAGFAPACVLASSYPARRPA
jgi:hypothetical protein